MHIFALLGHVSDPAFSGPPSVRNDVVAEQEQAIFHQRFPGVACFYMGHVDPDRCRPDRTPYCMPAALEGERHPSNAHFQPSSSVRPYEASCGSNADLCTIVVVSFNDINGMSSSNRNLSHLCTACCRFLTFFMMESILEYR